MQDTDQPHDLTVEELEELEQMQKEELRIKQVISGIAHRLEREAEGVVAKKADVEQSWYGDTRQYYGRYDAETEQKLQAGNKSRLFVHLTRPKTDTWIARIFDLMFPTDEKNWGIKPTPVPEMQASLDVEPKLKEGQQPTEAQAAMITKARASREYMEEASTRSESMSREMEDQLVEARYAAECRDAIEFMCKLGTGILKGPINGGRTRRRWVKLTDKTTGVEYFDLRPVSDARPVFTCTDPWNFFPDPNATRIEDAEFTYERHLWTKKKMRKMAYALDFDTNAVRALLEEGPQGKIPDYISQIRAIARQNEATIENRFVVWEYRGPIEPEELKDLFYGFDQADEWHAIEGEIDPLTDVDVVLYVCQGHVLKFGIHHLDSGEPIYSIVNFAKDISSMWGWGVPALMRDSQAAVNAAWRMMLDNGGLAAGPQVLVNQKAVTPADGVWELTARKVWKIKDDAPNGIQPFQVLTIDSNQSELANIINFGKQFIDEEVSLPGPMQGEQGGQVANTVHGLAMLMNSSNVIFRRVIKNLDDDLTVPCLRRLYDWNMQFNDKMDIKGDMQVDARGSSVLLVRELQSQNLMVLLQLAAQDPELAGRIKKDEGLKKVVQSMMLSSDDLIRNDEEYKEWQELQAATQQGPEQTGPSPEEIKLQSVQMELDGRKEIALINRETELMKLAEQKGMKIEELRTKLGIAQMAQEGDERKMAAEAGFKMKLAREEAAKRAVEVAGTSFGGAL